MSKRHIIINVGKAGSMVSKAAPDAYSIEATGYDMDEVHELFESVHAAVRPTDDELEPAERIGGPIPFNLSGFSLVTKFPEVNAEAWRTITGQSLDSEDPNAAAHSVADGPDRCDCSTHTPSPGRIAVRLNGVNHRFPTYGHARDFVELYGLDHTAVFILKATDPSLCCFPYTFQLTGSGEFMAFETREMAEEIAATYGVHDPEEITYHEDEHRPEHRVDEEAHRTRTKRAQNRAAGVPCSDDCACHRMSLAAANAPGKCSDTACRCHAVTEASGETTGPAAPEQPEDAGSDDLGYDDGSDDLGYDDGPRQRLVAADEAAAELAARTGLPIPAQRDDDKPRLPRRTRTISEHPDPCLPGCTCGNGPTPLAGDDTDA